MLFKCYLKLSLLTYPITSLSSLLLNRHIDELFSTSFLVVSPLPLQTWYSSTGGKMVHVKIHLLFQGENSPLHSSASPPVTLRVHTAQHGDHSSDNSSTYLLRDVKGTGVHFKNLLCKVTFILSQISYRLWPEDTIPLPEKSSPPLSPG